MTATLAYAALGLVLGLAFGYVHWITLKTVTALFLGGARGRAIALQLLRLALLALLMVALVAFGAPGLIAGALGVILAREIVLRRVRKEG